MLPRRLRLSRHGFAAAAQNARRAASPHLSVSIAEAAPNRGGCAVVVSKKVVRGSVGRHLLKRRILDILRSSCDSSRAIVVYARPGSASLSYAALKAELSALLGRLGLFVR